MRPPVWPDVERRLGSLKKPEQMIPDLGFDFLFSESYACNMRKYANICCCRSSKACPVELSSYARTPLR